jgi:hypothetical protein
MNADDGHERFLLLLSLGMTSLGSVALASLMIWIGWSHEMDLPCHAVACRVQRQHANTRVEGFRSVGPGRAGWASVLVDRHFVD